MNTPRTDEAKWETAPAAIVVSIYFAQTLERENVALREQLKDCSAAFDKQQEALDRNTEQIADKQAKIDALMFEYCPIEMSLEQIARWKKHQVVKEDGK
jgi:hypothetical protein